MLSQLTIPKADEAALDQQQLYAIGLKHVQRLASRLWTDYNVHDPGVTTLELLCYALTDLSYRASFPLQNLLASETANAESMQKQFFTARQILPNRPLTLEDYRKLLIDLKGVKNAWLQPATLRYYADTVAGKLLAENPGLPGIAEVDVAGLYEVTIEYRDDITLGSDKQAVLERVRQRLQANRNLGEDFIGFREAQAQYFILCGELELAANADIAQVKAEILFQVQRYLAPMVNNYSLSEMLARRKADGTPYTVDEIFDGPALDCGFIDDEELVKADLRGEIRLSDLIGIIMDIAGVRAVRDMIINPQGSAAALPNKWRVPVESGKKALLDTTLSRLVFYKRGMPVVPDNAEVTARYRQLAEAARAKAETETLYDLAIPLGRHRRPGDYYSFQNHFPAVYGLGEAGLSSAAGERRKALAYQLKAYLLFFDQVMADYFAQLSHIKDLFSTEPDLERTYFYQVVDSFIDYQKIYATEEAITAFKEDKNLFIDRRNRFLDHLIARFAESFNDFVYTLHAAFDTDPESIIGYKCEFLKHYPAVSSERSLAYNYCLQEESELWNSYNVSGLEKRLARLLGIVDYRRRNLSDSVYDMYAEVDTTPDNEFRFRIRNKDSGRIMLSSSTHYATQALAEEAMRHAIRWASLPAGYQRQVAVDGRHYFNIIDDTGEVIARRIEYFDTPEQMESAIQETLRYVQTHYSDEGLYLIENILLRPQKAGDPFLPICPDPAGSDGAGHDPYSYRLHIILPAYSGRFSQLDFRRFAEETIRRETPAHILPKVCWIGREDMAALEKAYRDWIYLKAGVETTERKKKLDAFIEILFAVKNIYPERNLYQCDSPQDRLKFILGQSALGTLKGET